MIRSSLGATSLSLLLCAATPAIAQGPTPDRPLRLIEVLEIGGDVVAEEYALMSVSAIGVGEDGALYVLDGDLKEVRVYDRAGRFIRGIGRGGEGPGEFSWPVALDVDSLVRVSDARHRRISTFRKTGEHVATAAVPAPDGVALREPVPLRSGGWVGVTLATFSPGTERHSPDIRVLHGGPGSPAVDTLFSYRSGGAVWHLEGQTVPWGVTSSGFGDGGALAVAGDSLVAIADGYTGRVRVLRDGGGVLEEVRVLQIPGRSEPVTSADLDGLTRRWREEDGPARSARNVVFDAPPRRSIAVRALFARNGDLWVRNSPGVEDGAVWTIFDARTPGVRRLRLPPGFNLLSVAGDHLYGSAKTAADSPLVRVYRLSESLF